MSSENGITTSNPDQKKPSSSGETSTSFVFDWGKRKVVYANKAVGHSTSARSLFGFLRLSGLVSALVVLGIAALVLYIKYGWW